MNIGIDMAYIPRFIDKEKLALKILSLNELEEYKKSDLKATYLASRFCLKEAFIKSIEGNILAFDLKEIEVVKKESGAVGILYQSKMYKCSLSHEKEYTVGVVIYD
ncbi:MAG TPA: 4'-phosphopantetheinyl transferase superfamily protein [Candidatus Onthovivens sp.]|nr:4'-phosphopantetheinyl transferase superfamily protein [Candidatus Onthovivens sp.]